MDNRFKDDCIYYDSDMKSLIKDFEDLKNAFDTIRLRFDRRDTIQLSPSVFHYYELSVLKGRNPEHFYSYHNDNVSVFINCPRKGLYTVNVYNFELEDSLFDKVSSSPDLVYRLKKSVTDISLAQHIFNDVVKKVVLGLNNELY